MRGGFLLAFLATALALSLVKWWAGLALIGALAAYYLLMRFAPWVFLFGGEPPDS
jgi:ABC-type transport system involved in cytochrome bd biosynthesis fused ATPase/permease subunit